MPKNTRNLIALGALFIVIIFVYGKNLFKGRPSLQEEETPKFEQSFEDVDLIGGDEQARKIKRIPTRWGRDPFVSDEEVFSKVKKIRRPRKLYLSGIAYKNGAYLAVIDGAVVKEGDVVEGRTVVTIKNDRVILKQKDKFEALKLRED